MRREPDCYQKQDNCFSVCDLRHALAVEPSRILAHAKGDVKKKGLQAGPVVTEGDCLYNAVIDTP